MIPTIALVFPIQMPFRSSTTKILEEGKLENDKQLQYKEFFKYSDGMVHLAPTHECLSTTFYTIPIMGQRNYRALYSNLFLLRIQPPDHVVLHCCYIDRLAPREDFQNHQRL